MKEEIREYALRNGAHVAGFATAEDFVEAPEGFRPTDIMPKAKSVIVLGKALSKGTVLSDNKVVYTAQGDTIVKDLDSLASKVAHYIESLGGIAVPIPTDAPYFHWEEERKHGMGILSHRHAAVKAGLGIIGKNSLLVTPQYGSRITLVSILTDLVLPADTRVAENLCPESCTLCIKTCPVGALQENRTTEQIRCRSNAGTTSARGHELTNCWKCRAVCPSAH